MTRRYVGQAVACVVAISLLFIFYILHIHATALPLPFRTPWQQSPEVAADRTTSAVDTAALLNKVVVVPKLSSEDTDWLTKEVPEWHPAIYTVDDQNATLHTSANKGKEALTYLRYIIDNYERLPETIAFIHSHKDGYPQAWHNDNSEYSNVLTLQWLKTDFVQRQGFVNLRCNGDPGCPAEIMLNRNPPDETRTSEVEMPAVWRHLFPDTPLPEILATACCAQIAVSRDQVRKRPRQDYERYRQWLLDTELDNEVSGRIMEYLWHVIFGQNPVFCPPLEQCYCDVYGQC